VLTGMPNMLQKTKTKEPEVSAQKPVHYTRHNWQN